MHLSLANLLFAPENWLVIGVIALLLYGRFLPNIARYFLRQFIELKNALWDIDNSFSADYIPSAQPAPKSPPPWAQWIVVILFAILLAYLVVVLIELLFNHNFMR